MRKLTDSHFDYMKKATAIITSFWKSHIFEYKSLIKLINGKTVLEVIVESLSKIDAVERIILATSKSKKDKPLVDEAKRLGIDIYRGAIDNLLVRLKNACNEIEGPVIKVDGNKPLFDYVEAEKLLHDHIDNGYDYSYNSHYEGVIYGTDCEVFNAEVLRSIDFTQLSAEQQVIGTIHLRTNSQEFKSCAKKHPAPNREYRVLFETQRDLEVINNIIRNVYPFTNEAISSFLDENPIVARHNRLKKPKEIGFNKIMLFPQKIEAIRKIDIGSPDSTYPVSVELSFTNRCNFNCIWCSDKDLRARQKDDMNSGTMKALAKDLIKHGTKGVVIEGGGEPTIISNFAQCINVFKSEGLGLGLITNGSQQLSVELINQFDWIRVSLDASCTEEMQKLKRHNGFEEIISNIILYAEQKPIVGIGYVATNQNISQIESLVIRMRESKVDYIQFRPVIDHPELLTAYDFEYLKKYQTHKFSIITDGMKENIIKGNNGIGCSCHSLSTVITADGSVFLCGRLNIYPWIKPIGNINEQSFCEIWSGKERTKQSNMVLDKDFCSKNCPECRITKFNIEFNRLNKIKTANFI